MKAASLLIAVVLLASAARADDAAEAVRMIAGEYDNVAHRKAEVGAVSTVPGKRLIKAPARYLFVRAVSLPNIPGTTAYLEWHDTTADGPVTTERIWSFRSVPDGLEMNFYTLLPPGREKLKGVATNEPGAAARAAGVTMDEVFSYHERCVFKFTRTADQFIGKLDPGACVMLQRSKNAYMTVEALVEFSNNRLREYTEFDYSRSSLEDEYENRVYVRVK